MRIHYISWKHICYCSCAQYFHHGKEEEEPEWMEFGPNDRFELIELVGLDEHEKEREGQWCSACSLYLCWIYLGLC